jgi:hypothetical protein
MTTLMLALVAALPVPAAPAPPGIDYAKKAAEAPWEWSDAKATAADSAKRCKGAYRAEIIWPQDRAWSMMVRITRGGKQVFTVKGHAGTVFAVRDDILYSASFSPLSTGCAVVAYDLKKRKELWKAPLKGIGPIAHSRYHNAANLDLDGHAVRVYGKESAGRYVEFVDLRSGKTIGHKIFPRQ